MSPAEPTKIVDLLFVTSCVKIIVDPAIGTLVPVPKTLNNIGFKELDIVIPDGRLIASPIMTFPPEQFAKIV